MPDTLFGLGTSHMDKETVSLQKSSWSSRERNPSSGNDNVMWHRVPQLPQEGVLKWIWGQGKLQRGYDIGLILKEE